MNLKSCVVLLVMAVSMSSAELVQQFFVNGFSTLPAGKHSLPDGDPQKETITLTLHIHVNRDTSFDIGFSTESEVGLMPFKFRIRDAGNGNELHLRHSHFHDFTPKGQESMVHDALSFSNSLPENVIVDLLGNPRSITTTFSYELKRCETLEPNRYDLIPGNASFGMLFQINVTSKSLSWYVKRRPPTPKFIAYIRSSDSGQLLKFAFVDNPLPEGVLFVDVFDLEFLRTKRSDEYRSMRFYVTFFEGTRQHVAQSTVHQFAELTRTVTDTLDIPSDDKSEMKFRVQIDDKSDTAALVLLQPYPIERLLIIVRDGVGDLIFAETEHNVPYLSANSTEQQFGWWRVFVFDELDKISNDTVIISAYYDKSVETPAKRALPAFKMKEVLRWVTEYGGNCSTLKPFVHETKNHLGLRTRWPIPAGHIVAEVPFRVLLTDILAMRLEVLNEFFNTTDWAAYENSFSHGKSFRKIVAMTVVVLLNALSPIDGTSWRHMFESLLPKSLPVPLLFNASEVDALFPVNTSIWYEIKMQEKTSALEYHLLRTSLHQKFEKSISLEDYRAARAHVVMWSINVTGEFVLAPLYNFLKVEEDPNIRIDFDFGTKKMLFVSTRAIPARALLTIGRAAETTTKTEYYVQYGQVPPASIDTALVFGTTFISRPKWSRRRAFSNLFEFSVDGNATEDDDGPSLRLLLEHLRARLEQLPKQIPPTASPDPQKVVYANRLLKGEREVIEQHIAYLEEDLSDL